MGEGERSASKVTRRLSSERERDDDDDDEKLEDPRCKTVLVSDRTDARDESVNRPQKSQHLKKQTRGINKGGGGQQLPPPPRARLPRPRNETSSPSTSRLFVSYRYISYKAKERIYTWGFL
jgi:hypothetical protein